MRTLNNRGELVDGYPMNVLNEKYTYERWMGICFKYGLEDTHEVRRLATYGVKVFHVLHYGGGCEMQEEVENREFFRDVAILTNVFENGSKVKLQASVPDGKYKMKHITIDFRQDSPLWGVLNNVFVSTLNDLLSLEEEISDTKDVPNSNEYRVFFKQSYLQTIIDKQSAKIKAAKRMIGRTDREIPKLGMYVHNFFVYGGKALEALNKTKQYCLIGDMIHEADENTIPDFEIIDDKDKSDMVMSWEESYLKILQ